MIRNYFKIAFRSILRNKTFSFINISGLSLGISCCLLLYLYVADELQYDRHQPRLNDIYRIDTKFEGIAGLNNQPSISPPIATVLRDELPEVEAATRLLNPPGVALNLIKYGENIFYEPEGYVGDSLLFDVLGFELLEGNPKKALTDANTVVLSKTLAKKIFGSESAMDQSILITQGDSAINFKITGVFRDDQKSFLQPHFVTSIMSAGWGNVIRKNPNVNHEWAGQNFMPAYVRLVPGHSQAEVEKKINDILQKHGAEDMKALGIKKHLFLEPIKDIYLRSATDPSQRITWIYVIVSIAGFILVIACINFMNLSTARSTRRATEIGMRKVMGAFRSSLSSQILGEAMIMVLISIVISVALLQLALPYFNLMADKQISFDRVNLLYFAGSLLALTVVTGFIAGSYPAFYISSFQPAQVLKGKFNPGNASGRLRQALVIFQFVIAIVLVVGMIVISRQLTFMSEKDLGFNASAKIVLPLRTATANHQYENLKKEFAKIASVEKVSGASYVPGSSIFSDSFYYKNGQTMENGVDIKRNHIDVDYIELLNIKLVAGRSFTDNRASESNGKLIINRVAAQRLGVTPEEAVGMPLNFDWQGIHHTFEVVGVMENIHQTSLKEAIDPLLYEISDSPGDYSYMIASVNPLKFKETIASLASAWKQQVSDTPFEYFFLDQNIQKQYDEDRKVSSIIMTFTAIAIFICSLGLYGLSSFMAERRIREIGVRKVMGAGVNQIVTMMSAEFIKLVLISFIIAVPLAWYGTHEWLKTFEYKTPLSISIFLTAGIGALIIALITVSFESFRAATVNPIKSLRSE